MKELKQVNVNKVIYSTDLKISVPDWNIIYDEILTRFVTVNLGSKNQLLFHSSHK